MNKIILITLCGFFTSGICQFDSSYYSKYIFQNTDLIIRANIDSSFDCNYKINSITLDSIPHNTCFIGKILEVLKRESQIVISTDSVIKIHSSGSSRIDISHNTGSIGEGIGYIFIYIDTLNNDFVFRPFTGSYINIPQYSSRVYEFKLQETERYPYANGRFSKFIKKEDLLEYFNLGLKQ